MITNIRIREKHFNTSGQQLHKEIKRTLNITSITKIEMVKVYRLQGCLPEKADYMARTLLADPITQEYTINTPIADEAIRKIEIAQKPEVMNPEVATLFQAATSLSIHDLIAADTSWEYHFYGSVTDEQIRLICNKLLMNQTIEQIIVHQPESLLIADQPGIITTIGICNMLPQELIAWAQERQLSFNAQELKTIQDYFKALNRDPYDLEIETIAQTWSEHCCHKTFKAPLIINGVHKHPLFTRLKETAEKYSHGVVSAFVDNAGAFSFYDGYAILAKVETHNSPSAIEPYGGAATGSGGVFRDIMGTGTGAQVIASTDMFCCAPPDLPNEQLPPGCLAPDYILRKVVAGVRDYGNRMGIPTNNGSVHFHEDFRAKPSVIVGAYGITPENKCKKGKPVAGDLIFLIGGRTGRDGIHGATFSSKSMDASTHHSNANTVQIGNAIEEKRLADAIIAARDTGIIRAITDCGAGGLSSAIGEMAADTGAHIELEKVPLKYKNINPWEIWVSESQERMVCALDPAHALLFQDICANYNVACTAIGMFTDTQTLVVTYHGDLASNISMEFLHNGRPNQPLHASYIYTPLPDFPDVPQPDDWVGLYCALLADWNICSKEPIVRQYDHGVQGTNALAPLGGIHHDGPNDAAIITPILGKPYGVIISHGMNPLLNRIDPYRGSWWAIVESLANLVAVGGDYRHAYLIDNFIWPYPDEYYLGCLDASLQACLDAMDTFKIPFISGKDSLSSTYKYPDGNLLHIPPVLCISAVGKIPDVHKTVSADFKKPNSSIILVGNLDDAALGGSIYAQLFHSSIAARIPTLDIKNLPHIFSTLHHLINAGIIHACHDISEGGIAVALAEMCFGSNSGAHLDLSFLGDTRADFFLCNETAGCFLIEVDTQHASHDALATLPHRILGTTTNNPVITMSQNNRMLMQAPIAVLKKAWQQPMKGIFSL